MGLSEILAVDGDRSLCLGGLMLAVHGTVTLLGRSAAMHSSMLAMHGTVALGRSATVHGGLGGGVLLMLAMHRTMNGTREDTMSAHQITTCNDHRKMLALSIAESP